LFLWLCLDETGTVSPIRPSLLQDEGD